MSLDVDRAPSVSFDRTPPQDVAAEQCVLGAMMLSKDAIADVVERLREDDFYMPAHQTVYRIILDLYSRGEPADAITVSAGLLASGELQRIGGAPYLHTLVASPPLTANASYYAQIVRDASMRRRLVEVGSRIVQTGYAGEGEVEDLINAAQAEVYEITQRSTAEDYAPLSDLLEGVYTEMESIKNHTGDIIGIPTGFIDLDNLTNGLHPGQMIVVAARPAMGKSTLGLDFARACSIKHGLTSAIFSLEMSRNEIVMRLLSAQGELPLHHMRSGTLNEQQWTRMVNTMSAVSNAPLFIDDSPNMSMMEIRAKCRRLKQQNDLRLIIIDYLQLMSSGKRVECSFQNRRAHFGRCAPGRQAFTAGRYTRSLGRR